MKKILFSGLIIVACTAFSQKLIKDEKGQLTTSKEVFLKGKINGELIVSDIIYPDSEFKCLEKLGQPINIDKSHTGAGDDYAFHYKGLSIYYSNVDEDKLTLVLVEFRQDGDSYLELMNGQNTIRANREFKQQFIGSNSENLEIPDSEGITVKFFDAEGSHIRFERDGDLIRKIKIYF